MFKIRIFLELELQSWTCGAIQATYAPAAAKTHCGWDEPWITANVFFGESITQQVYIYGNPSATVIYECSKSWSWICGN